MKAPKSIIAALLASALASSSSLAAVIDTDGDGLSDRQETEITNTDPNKPDTDGDTFTDQEEFLSGSNPNLASSVPMAGVLRALTMNIANDGTAMIDFEVRDVDVTTLVLETSTDMQDWEVDNDATIEPANVTTYRATASAPGNQHFFRLRGTGEGDAVSISAGFPASSITATEGESGAVTVIFSSPFTGYFSYTLVGVDSGGNAITPITEMVEVDGQSTVTLPISFGEDSTVGQLSRYEIQLGLDGVNTTPGTSQAQLIVLDNDEEWAGSLIDDGQTISVGMRISKVGANYTGVLISESPSGFLPMGEYPMSLMRHSHDSSFEMNPVNAINLTRSASDLPGSAMQVRLFLLAETGVGEQVVDLENGKLEGAYLITLSKPSSPHLDSTNRGEFILYRQPAKPSQSETQLEVAP